MKKRGKEKKRKVREPTGIKNDESDMPGYKNGSMSRSRSGTRRSLSSLFRRSAAKVDRYEQQDISPNDVESTTQPIDPRIEPRTHLQRMTVREALEYTRQRGRSPGKKALKLEKVITGNKPQIPRRSITSSLPDISDSAADVMNTDENNGKLLSYNTGSTLPRVKQRRFRKDTNGINMSDVTGDLIPRSSVPDYCPTLPLDKRKYYIHHDLYSDERNNVIAPYSDDICAKETSNIPAHSIPDNLIMFPSTEYDQKRLESLNHFLHLASMAPIHSHRISFDSGEEKADQEHSRAAVHVNNLSKSMVFVADSPAIHTTDVDDKFTPKVLSDSSITNQDTSTIHKTTDFVSTKHENNSVDQSNLQHSNVINKDNFQQCASDIKEEHVSNNSLSQSNKRGAYISPRRFYRSSKKTSVSSKYDTCENGIDASNKDVNVQNTDVEQNRNKVSYVQHSDRHNATTVKSNRKTPHKEKMQRIVQKVDKQTNTNSIICEAKLTESSTQTDDDIEKSCINLFYQKTKTNENIIGDTYDSQSSGVIYRIGVDNLGQSELEDKANRDNLSKRDIVSVNTSDKIQPIDQEQVFKTIESKNKIDIGDTKSAKCVSIDVNVIDKFTESNISSQSEYKVATKTKSLDTPAQAHSENLHDEMKNKDTVLEESRCDLKKEISLNILRKRRNKKKTKDKKNTHCTTEKQQEIVDNVAINDMRDIDIAVKNNIRKKDKVKLVGKSQHKTSGKLQNSSKKNYKSVQEALVNIGKAASLSNIYYSKESVCHEEPIHRRHSDDLSICRQLEKDQSIKNMSKPSTKGVKDSDRTEMALNVKLPGKLSIASIVAIKAKFSRRSKKGKRVQCANIDAAHGDIAITTRDVAKDLNTVNVQDNSESNDRSIAKVYYENEINASIGKQSDSLSELITEVDKEVKDFAYDKTLQFASYCDPISEEELIKRRQRNTRLTSRRESKIRQRQKKVINCCKSFVAFLFSHIGLCSLVVAYSIMGGFIFKELEGQKEIETKKEMTHVRENFTERIYRLAFETAITKGSRETFRLEVNTILKNYSMHVFRQTKDAGWDGKDVSGNGTSSEPEQWSLPSSLLYAITVMTTIGYGHVAPKTDEGRIMTIAYAVLGIPLTLLCLTNIGDVMAHGFRMLYGKVFCGICCLLFGPRRRRRRLDPEKGIPTEERMVMQEEEKSEEVIHVPTSVCLLLMTAYIMLGTLLFSNWENWDAVTGTYFCFITLSTIGFGDVVPGVGAADWNTHEKLVSCALYLVFGLSLIAMCFNLVQEDVKAKCKWLGMKLGIIDKPVSNV